MSAREAIATLEAAGYNVSISGSGFVRSQTPAPGTLVGRGARINLALSR